MLSVQNLTQPPQKLGEYFEMYFATVASRITQRTVLVCCSDGIWRMLSCVVSPTQERSGASESVILRYKDCILRQQWLDKDGLKQFLAQVQEGRLEFGDTTVTRGSEPSWSADLVPLHNEYMGRAGYVVSAGMENFPLGVGDEPLVKVGMPYYPDVGEAARAWTRFPRYNGVDDGRNRRVIFLLPEIRAYFTDAVSEQGKLELIIDGTESKRDLYVKGAYWLSGTIHSFEESVREGKVVANVPDYVDRLEYVLTDQSGAIFDFQREAGGSHTGLSRRRVKSGENALIEKVRNACVAGEGMRAEFKPFVELSQKEKPAGENAKFQEIVRTVVAFANAEGGDIFLGVDDHCQLKGIDAEVSRWSKSSLTDGIEKYRGALVNAVNSHVVGKTEIAVAWVALDGVHVVVISVSANLGDVAGVRGDSRFYARAGSSNRQIPPGEWSMRTGQSLPWSG